jgi:hypothetical protein
MSDKERCRGVIRSESNKQRKKERHKKEIHRKKERKRQRRRERQKDKEKERENDNNNTRDRFTKETKIEKMRGLNHRITITQKRKNTDLEEARNGYVCVREKKNEYKTKLTCFKSVRRSKFQARLIIVAFFYFTGFLFREKTSK